ncbi:heparin lyase I family protein [Microvirga pudoricolor]|uniref:heparin lyase I family protein n=1 Tax=Microvirga pudoricolor TaxID=2778729 RepID=UPI00194E10B9|nr:heparin lyase I family protein [Microvirga pudoricolor]MBM6596544.1 heparin lyase I family protein [Microvirga pudoricolor]
MSYFEPDTYKLQSAGKDWSYAADGSTMRFELRPGDRWAKDSDGSVERSELASYKTLDYEQTYTISYKFMIEPGETNTSKWIVLGQLHATEDAGDDGVSPPYGLDLIGERMEIHARWSDQADTNWDNVNTLVAYKDEQDIERGHWYDMKVTLRLDPFGDGMLDVWRDGVQLVDYDGPLGYHDEVGPYWKHGAYRKASDETIAVNYKDFSLVEEAGGQTPLALEAQSDFEVLHDPPGRFAGVASALKDQLDLYADMFAEGIVDTGSFGSADVFQKALENSRTDFVL